MKQKNCSLLSFIVTACMLGTAFYNLSADEKASEAGQHVRNLLKIPWLSTHYIKPQITPDEPVNVGFYVTDWYQSEYRLMDNTHRFHVTLKIRKKEFQNRLTGEEKILEKRDLKAGDHEFDAGKFPEGEYQIALSATDQAGRKSTVVFHEFRVKKDFSISKAETYQMSHADLQKYNISNQGNIGIFHFIDTKGMSKEDVAARIAEEAGKINVPDGKYAVVAGAEKYDPAENKNHRGTQAGPVPEWLPDTGSWKNCKVIYASDYDKEKVESDAVATGTGLNKLLQDAKEKGYRQVVLLPGTYRISHTAPIAVPSGITLDLNGSVIKLNQFTGAKCHQIYMRDTFDTHIINGIIEGDYFEHDYKNSPNHSEWVIGILMEGEAKYCSVERVLVRYVAGYGVAHGYHPDGYYATHIPLAAFEYGTVDEKTGEYLPDAEGLAVSDLVGVAGFLDDGGYAAVSRYLGYQGMSGGRDWSLRFHFYDDNGNYLETVYGRQYRRVRVPEKAGYMRVTAYIINEPPGNNAMYVNLFRSPWNSWYKDLFILSARCVGMVPSSMYNFRIENCTFARSGESAAKCAFDAEDGWDMMQDVWIVRNKFFKNPTHELLTCAGHNFIIEDNEGQIFLWDRTNAYTVRNNHFTKAYYGGAVSRYRTGLSRITGNTYSGAVHLGGNNSIVSKTDGSIEAIEAIEKTVLAAVEQNRRGEKEQMPDPWFITMQDIGCAPELRCSTGGMIAGMTLKNPKLTGQTNLLYSTLDGGTDLRLGGSVFVGSKLNNIKGSVIDGVLVVSGSELRNCEIDFRSGGIVIRNSTLENVNFKIGYWNPPLCMILENCTIKNNGKPLIDTGVYSIGDFRFVNCKTDTGSAAVINICDMRQNNNGKGPEFEPQTGKIRFDNCEIASQKNCVVAITSKGESKKKIVITAENSKYPQAFVHPKPEHWVSPEPEKAESGTTADTVQETDKAGKNKQKKLKNSRKNRKSSSRLRTGSRKSSSLSGKSR